MAAEETKGLGGEEEVTDGGGIGLVVDGVIRDRETMVGKLEIVLLEINLQPITYARDSTAPLSKKPF